MDTYCWRLGSPDKHWDGIWGISCLLGINTYKMMGGKAMIEQKLNCDVAPPRLQPGGEPWYAYLTWCQGQVERVGSLHCLTVTKERCELSEVALCSCGNLEENDNWRVFIDPSPCSWAARLSFFEGRSSAVYLHVYYSPLLLLLGSILHGRLESRFSKILMGLSS